LVYAAYGIHSGHTLQSVGTRKNKKESRNLRREQTLLSTSTIGSCSALTSPSFCGAHHGLEFMGRMPIYGWLSITHQPCRGPILGAQSTQKLSMRSGKWVCWRPLTTSSLHQNIFRDKTTVGRIWDHGRRVPKTLLSGLGLFALTINRWRFRRLGGIPRRPGRGSQVAIRGPE
jgi:hypothetical protein